MEKHEANKLQIISLLNSTKRASMDEMIEWLEEHGYFEAPGSTRFHGCYKGGLAQHSLNVYEHLTRLNILCSLGIDNNVIIISTLLHDVCKVGQYLGDSKPYRWNPSNPKGHASLSLQRVSGILTLTKDEADMIRYHMGAWGSTEFDCNKGEYDTADMMDAYKNNVGVRFIYFADESAAAIEKAEEN